MFKKLKDKLEEEFKQGPLKFPVSVQQLAQVISPSPSLNSLSDNNAGSSATCTSDPSSVSANFFSIGDDDDSQDGSVVKTLPLQSIDLSPSSPSNMTQNRSRRSSLSSVTSEASSLFPIFENPSSQIPFQSDLESEMEDGMASQIEKISKEQLYQSYKKVFNRYNKYKGRYVDLQRHYKDLLHDNVKTKNVLQESQDKALRRIAELKEQCQLEQNAKAHLEEALRNDVEDRDHIITTLKTKISLLRSGAGSDGLIDVHDKDEHDTTEIKTEELEKLKLENENLQKEITNLKKLKDTACHLIHRCDTTIEEATEDVNNENLKRKMSELKSEIQKMKSENESLSNLLSKNIIMDDDKKSQSSTDGSLLIDFSGMDSSQSEAKMDEKDEKDKKIEKLNNLLLKCKEKISSLNADIKGKSLIIENKSKRLKELTDELESNKKLVTQLTTDVEALKLREEENVLSVAENKMAIHKELENKEEQIRALNKELKTSETVFKKEKEEIIERYEEKIREMSESFSWEVTNMKEENEKLTSELKSKMEEDGKCDDFIEKTKEWERQIKKTLDLVLNDGSYQRFIDSKSAEIERVSCRLEERISAVQKKIVDFVQMKEKEIQDSRNKIIEATESQRGAINDITNNVAAEYKERIEKLNSEIRHLSEKVEELELALTASEKENERIMKEKTMILKEKDKIETALKERVSTLEGENQRMKANCLSAEAENKRLGDELCNHREKLKSAEGDNRLWEKVNREKTEAEKKLREYIDNYNKLEKENRLLESDLNEKCEKLLRDLSESREKIKFLEVESNTKNKEIEDLKSGLSQTVGKNESLKAEISEMEEKLKTANDGREELSKANEVLSEKFENAMTELSSLTREHSVLKKEKSEIDEEIEKLKNELKTLEEDLKNATSENVKIGNDLDERLNGLETIKNNLSSELKNLEEKLENESKINEELKDKVQKELEEKNVLEGEIVELKSMCGKLQQDMEKSSKEVEGLMTENENLKRELSEKVEELSELNREKSDFIIENEKLKLESVESEKAKLETTEKMKELLNERNEMSDSLQVKLNELETVKVSLNSTRDELSAKIKALEEEKERLSSENENKLNILKNEIKFMNNKFEEDIGNMEENRSLEVNELNSRMAIAERTSQELLEKLEKITGERDEGKAAVEERDIKITELEACITKLKAEVNEKFNHDTTAKESESGGFVDVLGTDDSKRENELDFLRAQNQEYSELIKSLKSANARFKGLGNEPGTEKEMNEPPEKPDAKKVVLVDEDVIEKERRTLSGAGKEVKTPPDIDNESMESIQKRVIQQANEIRELQKQHKREVTELRKIISMKRKSRRNSAESPDWGGTLDNDTEHEYLRNILYEYMMGREQLVLAKVLSAIVKFDKQQTRNVLEKEQHRQTLFGHLGIL